MEHVVFYPGTDGAEAFVRVASLEAAVRQVEHLRNDNGIGDVTVFALHAVPLAFRTYVHVELPAGEMEQAEPSVAEVAADEPTDQFADVEAPVEAPVEALVEAPVEFLLDAPLDAPLEAPEEFAAAAPFDVVAEAPAELVDEAPVEFFAEAPAEPAQALPPIAIPEFEASASELPPLTLAPGPLLFDADGSPIASSGSYDMIEERPADLTDLIPADFTDLIPKDIVHGDLVRHVDEPPSAPEAVTESLEPALPALPELPEPPAFEAEPTELPEPVAQAPSTDELPPMDVAEIPADVSSIELLDGAPIPAAREAIEDPERVVLPEGVRGLGYFGG